MAYSDVEWTNGDVLTEAKLDQMAENEAQAYHAAEAVQIYTCEAIGPHDSGSSSTAAWGLYIDGVQVGADLSTVGSENVLADLSLLTAGIGVGIHEVEIRFGSTNVGGGVFKFFVSNSHNYLTIWLTPTRTGSSPAYKQTASDITVIMHIEAKTWT